LTRCWGTLLCCWALMGPHEASGPLDGELSVQCWYARGYETYIKYWCRGTDWKSCHVAVQTSDSEAIAKQSRVSIRDIHTFCMFMVTMKNLTEGDSGIYWCGIERLGSDLMTSVKVSVLPGKFLHESHWIFTGLRKVRGQKLRADSRVTVFIEQTVQILFMQQQFSWPLIQHL
uniref:Immunoglobulin domain-containing protein n=1 Tax=Pelusios castaneus TaxID=367368 RepID=A0A8C8S4T9_9SAUR